VGSGSIGDQNDSPGTPSSDRYGTVSVQILEAEVTHMDVVVFTAHAAAGFLAIMNPVGNAPIFLGLTDSLPRAAQRSAAMRSVAYAFIIVAAFAVAGELVFRAFGITLPAFRIAGGLLLFVVGYQLLHGRESAIHHPAQTDRNGDSAATDVAITPLAIPILAGPGTISTAMSMVAPQTGMGHATVVVLVLAVFAAVCALTLLCFVLAERLVALLGTAVIRVITRLMGLLLTVVAAQMLIQGIAGAVTAYQSGITN
jgi:multiple antibiotic resistance protein